MNNSGEDALVEVQQDAISKIGPALDEIAARSPDRKTINTFEMLHSSTSLCRPCALAPRPIFHAHDARRLLRAARLHSSFETAQYRVVAGRHANSLDQALSRTPADAMAQKINDFGRPFGAARSRHRDLGQLRGERLTLAGFVSTQPALEAKLHSDRGALRG
jgi:hypothetical protein